MLPEKAKADALYIAWDLAHRAEKESGEKMRAESQMLWKSWMKASEEAEAARWREKVLAGPDISPEELKALKDAVKAAERLHALATKADHAARAAVYECEERLRAAKKFVAVRKELEKTE